MRKDLLVVKILSIISKNSTIYLIFVLQKTICVYHLCGLCNLSIFDDNAKKIDDHTLVAPWRPVCT